MFRFHRLHVENYRCFEDLDLSLEDDLTVLFAENGGGKTALLAALAMGLSAFQRGSPQDARPKVARDVRQIPLDDRRRREPAGPYTLTWSATIGPFDGVDWTTTLHPASNRTRRRHGPVLDAIERTRIPGERWPLFAWYGTERLRHGRRRMGAAETTRDRWEGYASSLDPTLDDAPLLKWFTDEILSDAVRRREGEAERFLDAAVAQAMVRATPGVDAIWYEPAERSPSVRFHGGDVALWSELSDGYHAFLALVADIARRAVILNEMDGGEAPEKIEGVVLIDEIDLHLHPRWQRVVLEGLRAAFPRLQLVVTTHSPLVLSSVSNRQVRWLVNGRLREQDVHVEGRDANAIIRELALVEARGDTGVTMLRELYDAIDAENRDEAKRLYTDLLARWGDRDPELIRARGFMDWEE